MSLVVTIQSGAIEFEHSHGDGYTQVNVYHIDSHYTGKAKAFLTELLAAMKDTEWFDKSEIMAEAVHVSHYCDINIGKWNKPYFLQNTAKKAPKKPVQASKTIKVPAKATFSNAVEDVARMTNAERDKFVEDMIASYPNLADDLLTKIGFGLMDAENG